MHLKGFFACYKPFGCLELGAAWLCQHYLFAVYLLLPIHCDSARIVRDEPLLRPSPEADLGGCPKLVYVARATDVLLADYRWIGPHGIGRFANELRKRLPALRPLSAFWPLLHPLEPVLLAGVLYALRPLVYFSPGFNPPVRSPGPFVFTIHDLIHLRVPAEASRAKQAYYRLVVRPAAHRAYRVLTVSQYTHHDIVEWTGLPEERVVVVGNGIGPAFTPGGGHHTPGYPYLLYVGNRKPHKNLARLLQGFAHSGLQHDICLVLTGMPDAALSQQMRALQLQNRVVYAGDLTEPELAAYYRGAVAVVCPSLYEGFGLSPLEAMACGTPVVTSNRTALPEVVEEAAVLVDPYDVEAIAWGIHRVVDDQELRQALAHKGLARARQFTWEQTVSRVWQVLQEAAADT
jgi:glycosyltransferase involved in cell wall biosynthesis